MGGNVFYNTESIKRENIEPTITQFKLKLNEIFPKIDFNFNFLGSAGKKDISNDIDLALSESIFFTEKDKLNLIDLNIDENQLRLAYIQIRKRVKTSTIKQSKLRALINVISHKLLDNEIITNDKNSGAGSLFCCFPQYNEKREQLNKTVQIDINIGNLDWLNFSYYSKTYENNIKGLHRTQLIVALFSYKNRTFRHGSGIFNHKIHKYEANTPEEAILLLNKLYNLEFTREILNDFFSIYNYILCLNKNELYKIYDIYLKILDSTRTDIPYMLQDYWKENEERLQLTGNFLPENSNLYKFRK